MDYQGDGTRRRYSVEFRQRAVRMVYQLREETGEDVGAIQRVAGQLGCGVESLRTWVKRDEIDRGERPGVTSSDVAEIKKLRQEVQELRRSRTDHHRHPREVPMRRVGAGVCALGDPVLEETPGSSAASV